MTPEPSATSPSAAGGTSAAAGTSGAAGTSAAAEPSAAAGTSAAAEPSAAAGTSAAGGTSAAAGLAQLVAELTLDEKILLLAGADFWHTNPLVRLGIPALRLSDGPSGARGERSVGPRSVSFPCGIAIGATFDPSAASELGAALADECLDKNVHALLGPTVNLHRHPLGGRHFESYSEDPWLSAQLCVAYVEALQARGVSATVKHFVANDSEFERHTISSDVDEASLRELYLLPFEAAVHDAGAWAVMSAYNKINGTYAAENDILLADILRREWGFDGVVVSDWYGTQSTVASANAGLDLEMPGPGSHYGKRLHEAVSAGEVSEATIDEHVRRLLRLAGRTGALGLPAGDTAGSTARSAMGTASESTGGDTVSGRASAVTTLSERQATARRLAAASFVLLKNDGAVLPWRLASGATVAVIGPNAATTSAQGGGSARVNAYRRCSVLASLRDRLEPQGITVAHERGCVTWAATPVLEADFQLEYYSRGPAAAVAEASGQTSGDGQLLAEERGSSLYEHDASVANFTWLGDPAPGVAGLSDGNWRLRCRAAFTPDVTGKWLFSLTQVGQARLLVDGETVVEATGEVGRSKSFFGMGSAEAKGNVPLAAHRAYDLVVEYEPTAGLPLAGLMIGALPPVGSDEDLLGRAEKLAASADAVVCVVGTTAEWETEGHDRQTMSLPGLQDDLVRRVAAANPKTCVLVNSGAPVSMDWTSSVPVIAQIWFPGEQGGEGVTDVLLGDTDPGGRLPTTFPRRLEDTPAFACYPGSDGHVQYEERFLTGYRHYDANAVDPLFAFGHGLSYSTFRLSDLEVGTVGRLRRTTLGAGFAGDPIVEVTVTVTNTGTRLGTEVVQCYVAKVVRQQGEPEQQLRGVAKVHLAPGESAHLTILLNERSFASWDMGRHGFVALPGVYEVRVGRSSRDLPLRTEVTLD
ncbi:MAG: glycoside hydrolase family 3 protein [Acidimicrobiales bacterium]